MWRHNRRGLWLNYGFCPNCNQRHPPRVGSITCVTCGRAFDNRGFEMRVPSTPGGLGLVIAGGFAVAAVLLVFALAGDWVMTFLAGL